MEYANTDILDGSNEKLEISNSSPSISLDLTSPTSQTFTFGGASYTLTVSNLLGKKAILIKKASSGTIANADAEALVDAISYKNSSSSPSLGDRIFMLNVYESPLRSADVYFTVSPLIITLYTTESPDSLTLCAGQTLEIASTTSHYAMDFDGSYDVISFTGSAHNTAFSNNTQTVELWFKTTDATGPMLGYSGTNYSSSQSSFVPILGLVNGKIRGEFWTNSATNAITSFTNYNDGNFHHVALTSNGTSFSMYVDGVLYILLTERLITVGQTL